jgi:hypothetical protein
LIFSRDPKPGFLLSPTLFLLNILPPLPLPFDRFVPSRTFPSFALARVRVLFSSVTVVHFSLLLFLKKSGHEIAVKGAARTIGLK